MIGLMMLLALGLYLAITVGAVALTVRWAKRNGRGVWRWGIAAGFLMYLLVFWDHIPTLILYKHYCATKAGFWVYKTPEQWKAENPGVAETLTWRDSSPSFDNNDGTWGLILNERFILENRRHKTPILPIALFTNSVVDVKNGELMVTRISVGTGYSGGKELYRFWTKLEPYIPNKNEFAKYQDDFKHFGREVK